MASTFNIAITNNSHFIVGLSFILLWTNGSVLHNQKEIQIRNAKQEPYCAITYKINHIQKDSRSSNRTSYEPTSNILKTIGTGNTA
jgi:hypothetical protein